MLIITVYSAMLINQSQATQSIAYPASLSRDARITISPSILSGSTGKQCLILEFPTSNVSLF